MVRQLARPTVCQAYLLARDLIHRTSELAGVPTVVFSESAVSSDLIHPRDKFNPWQFATRTANEVAADTCPLP